MKEDGGLVGGALALTYLVRELSAIQWVRHRKAIEILPLEEALEGVTGERLQTTWAGRQEIPRAQGEVDHPRTTAQVVAVQ